ncbi:MAG TPA: response regulator transcription factor [Albitalea sp.]|uniref:response regulator n=1 Tax=Piscinibacter sp. TaxID=1903157 RepID=UPI002ED397CF
MPSNRPVRVLVVDDHAGIRAGISSLVDGEHPSMCSIGVAATANEALVQVQALQPDVVLLDVNLAGEDGLVLIPEMRRTAPCEIVVLTSLMDPHIAAHARRLGARGYVHKTAPASELLASILLARDITPPSPRDQGPAIEGVALSHVAGDQTPRPDGRDI